MTVNKEWNEVIKFAVSPSDKISLDRTNTIINTIQSKFIQNKHGEFPPGSLHATPGTHFYPIYDAENNQWGIDTYIDSGEDSQYHLRLLFNGDTNTWLEYEYDGENWVSTKTYSVS